MSLQFAGTDAKYFAVAVSVTEQSRLPLQMPPHRGSVQVWPMQVFAAQLQSGTHIGSPGAVVGAVQGSAKHEIPPQLSIHSYGADGYWSLQGGTRVSA